MQAFEPYAAKLRTFMSTEFGGFTPEPDECLERQLKEHSPILVTNHDKPCWQEKVTFAYAYLQVGNVVDAWEVAVDALRVKFITENFEASTGNEATYDDPRSYYSSKWNKEAAIDQAGKKVADIAKGYLEPLIRAYRESK